MRGSIAVPRRLTVFPFLRAFLHVVVVTALVLGLVAAGLAEDYFTRGVATDVEYDPIPHTDVNPMAINTFFDRETDPAAIERSLDMIQAAGFGYIRQVFAWGDIEKEQDVFVHANGRSTWETYDDIVALAHERGIEIIARLEQPPRWARWNQPAPDMPGPPDRLADYADFVERVVARYHGKVNYVQIWNEPNLEGEWGGGPIDARAYVDLLEAGYRAAKRANLRVVVLLAGLAPNDQRGPDNLSDLLFLQQVYDYGGAPFFDIATVMVYGYGFGPYDRRVDFWRNNFSRPIQTREIMLRNGDGETPVWAVEYGWVALPDDWQGEPSVWGQPVRPETQAEYLVEGYLRAQREWPWMGVMAIWAFRFPEPPEDPDQAANPTRGFAIVEHDFSPRLAYTALARAAPLIQRSGTGAYALSDAQRSRIARGDPLTLRILGERLDLVVEGSGALDVTIDGEARETMHVAPASGGQARLVAVAKGLSDGPHDVTVRVDPVRGTPLGVRGYVVSRTPIHSWIYPWIDAALVIVLLLNLVSAAWMAWDHRSTPVPILAGDPSQAAEFERHTESEPDTYATYAMVGVDGGTDEEIAEDDRK